MLVAAASALVFILLLPTTPSNFADGGWTPLLGVKPLGDDAHDYLNLAEAIRSKHEYSFQGKPTRMRPPIYPLFFAGVQSIFGANIRFVQAIQALLVTGTIAIIFFLSRRVFGTRVSFLATLWLGLYILWTVRAALVMAEALLVFLLVLSTCLLIVAIQEQKSKYYGDGGAVLAVASRTRSITLLLPVLLIATLMISGRRQTRLAHR